jgi:hydrophobic/amphiphilic exporter-1 (mainly G- bacteria), HAE1 family
MRSIVQWAVRNSPGMNTLMIAVLLVGTFSLAMMRREVFPEFELEIILVSVPYPGASPDEVEEGICQKIEEAVRSISGIKKQTSVAAEGVGSVILELEANTPDVQKILGEVRSEVDRIPSFPALAEDPEVKQITLRQPAIRVGVIGPDSQDSDAEYKLRAITEDIRDELLQLPSVSQANLMGARDYQIDIEIPEHVLRKYGLTLQDVAQIVRRENVELPGGTIKTDSQEVLVRGKNKRQVGPEIENIPLLTEPNGVVLTVGDLGVVRDEFADTTSLHRIEGQPGLVISIDRTSSEDLLLISQEVKAFVESKAMPAGYELRTWFDQSVDVRDRMELLTRNGLQGLLLVFLVLAIFLELKLAFWVALGIPISILGACAVLLYTGQTLNMLSMFAFLMALGIVVDDAIVIGENIYAHRERGKKPFRAAIDGTVEVFPSVLASVMTTIIAFAPLMYVSGVMGKFIAVLPVAVIAMLIISLIESMIILPCHLAHADGLFFRVMRTALYPLRPLGWLFAWLNVQSNRFLDFLINRTYMPALKFALHRPDVIVCGAIALLLLSAGFVRSGITPFIVFPKLDSNIIEAKVIYPDGTPADVTDRATQRIEQSIRDLNEDYATQGAPVVRLIHRAVGEVSDVAAGGNESRTNGSHVGSVFVELHEVSQRDVSSEEIVAQWRKRAGDFSGAESVTFGAPRMGPGGTPIEFKLLAESDSVAVLEEAVEKCKSKLREYPGVFDVADDSRPGKWEFQLQIKERARAMGVPLAELAETVRAAYYGEEVMRLQRGRHEVKLMVRYPESDRRSLGDFENIRIRMGDGAERPLTELAHVTIERGDSEINRVNQLRSITISADVNEAEGNARNIVRDLQAGFMPQLFEEYPGLRVRWEGQQEQTVESMESLVVGFVVAILAMFALLTLQFRSYLQPLMILAIIPFGAIGAVMGHAVLGLPLTLFSVFGLVALTGVVVNDSIVLIDFINHRVRERDDMSLKEALLDAGRRRFRPVLLTSITTIAGLFPLLTERSFQAQILIPMAASLCFGLLLATFLILLLVPTYYYIYARLIPSHNAPDDADDVVEALNEPHPTSTDGRDHQSTATRSPERPAGPHNERIVERTHAP